MELPRLKSPPAGLEALARLGWVEGLALESHGVRIGLRVNSPGHLPRLAPHLPCGWRPARSARVDFLYSVAMGPPRGAHSLYAGGELLVRTRRVGELLDLLESSLRRLVAEHAPRHVFVHAGVVAWQGRALVIPGRSCSGKTTLVAELVRAGATYYSDEYAVLDARGRVLPYAKPLSLRLDATGLQTHVPVESLGGTAGQTPLPVGCVLVTRFQQGARFRPRPLSPGQAVLALLQHAVAARAKPAAVLAALQRAAAPARAFRSLRGEARALVPAVLALGD